MEFHSIHWRQNQAIAEAYIHSFDEVRTLYAYDWRDDAAIGARAERLDRQTDLRAPAEAVVNALVGYNERIGNDPAAVDSIRRLGEKGTLVVVGGQQAGLLTGPLLVFYKAISVIRAARRAEQRLGRTVLPVFWIAGEDHDFAEVNHVYTLGPQSAIEKTVLAVTEEEASRRLSVSRRAIGRDQWERVLAEFEAVLPQTEFTAGLLADLRDIHYQSGSLSEAFARLMARLFGKFGLVLMDSDDTELRRVEGPFFSKLIMENDALGEALSAGTRAVQKLGFKPQAEVRENGANLFLNLDGERVLLFRESEGRFADKGGERRFSADDLCRMAVAEPGSLSNNVFTRPLMQEYVLPVLATVLGPGEIAYWGQLGQAFSAFGMDMPVILPRTEFSLVEGTVRKQMGKLGLTFGDAVFRLEERKEEWLRERDAAGIGERFAEVKEQFSRLYEPVLQLAESVNPGLKSLGETNLAKILEQVAYLESRVRQAHESQHEAALRQFERIRLSLVPLGKRQERVYNGFAFINKYGSEWIGQLVEGGFKDSEQHIIVYL